MTAVDPLRARLDQLADAHDLARGLPWGTKGPDLTGIDDAEGLSVGCTWTESDAALIVAAVNALDALLSVVRGVADLADRHREHNGHEWPTDGEPDCPGCWGDRLAALLAPLTEGNPT